MQPPLQNQDRYRQPLLCRLKKIFLKALERLAVLALFVFQYIDLTNPFSYIKYSDIGFQFSLSLFIAKLFFYLFLLLVYYVRHLCPFRPVNSVKVSTLLVSCPGRQCHIQNITDFSRIAFFH